MTLDEWLDNNKIKYEWAGRDLISIPGFGTCLFQDLNYTDEGLFMVTEEGEVRFNCIDSLDGLRGDGVGYVIVNFGDGFYYIDINKDFKLEVLKYVGEYTGNPDNKKFANIGCHDAYELLNGSFLPKDWVKKAKWMGHRGIGICNNNTMASLYNLQCECKSAGLKYVFGYELTCRLTANVSFKAKVYAQTQEGLRHLLRIQKAIMVDNPDEKEISYEELIKRGHGNVLVFDKLSPLDIDLSSDWVADLCDNFDKSFYQFDLTEYKAERIDVKVLEAYKEYHLSKCEIPPALIPDCYYLDMDDAKNKLIVNKIACGAAHDQSDQQYFRDYNELFDSFVGLFEDREFFERELQVAADNANSILDGCTAVFEDTRNFMPKYDMLPEEKEKYGTTHNMFLQLLQEGLDRLAPKDRYDEYKKRMLDEIYVIESTNNIDYLLVQWDCTNWCRRNNIYVGCGRGSAAGCLLLYLLGITLVDPIKYNLLFARFLLPERAGLYQATTAIINGTIESQDYVNVTLENGRTVKFDRDAKFVVKRNDEVIVIYADELEEGDDIQFDNKDELFTINEI